MLISMDVYHPSNASCQRRHICNCDIVTVVMAYAGTNNHLALNDVDVTDDEWLCCDDWRYQCKGCR